ncbi:hypothetical protein BM221_007213 [Beauveria bassiana]|uniref:Uncharacterized protein n=1 Tax=Beauveria bassiana TaxID=176275 RepID=A0A2N6NJS8_BEABA|nr:hypothetical protein BM221_007213 [Beauveria bassiana]
MTGSFIPNLNVYILAKSFHGNPSLTGRVFIALAPSSKAVKALKGVTLLAYFWSLFAIVTSLDMLSTGELYGQL